VPYGTTSLLASCAGFATYAMLRLRNVPDDEDMQRYAEMNVFY
jgi:hypothetical protein